MKASFALASLVAVASALTVTQPTDGTSWDFSQSNTIEWTSVSTDQTSFKLVLVNHKDSNGPSESTLAETVKTADNKYTISNVVAEPGDKYTIRLISLDKSNSGQLAESHQFNVTKSGTAPTTTSSSNSQNPSNTASAGAQDSTPSPSPTHNAASTGKTFGAAGIVAVVFAMFF